MTDLLGGHVDFAFAGLSVMLPHIKATKVRAIAVSVTTRNPQLPDVPTVAGSLPGFEIPTWIGLVAPNDLPLDVRDKILAAIRDTMAQREVSSRLGDSAFHIMNRTSKEFVAHVEKDSGFKADLCGAKSSLPSNLNNLKYLTPWRAFPMLA